MIVIALGGQNMMFSAVFRKYPENYNQEKETVNCLNDLYDQDYKRFLRFVGRLLIRVIRGNKGSSGN